MPGIQVVAPWSVEDTRGLQKAAIRDDDPIVFLENEMMYGINFDVSDEVLGKDFLLPISKAKIERLGTDITITAFSKMVGYSLQAADIVKKQYGIEEEVINLRTIKPFDRKTII